MSAELSCNSSASLVELADESLCLLNGDLLCTLSQLLDVLDQLDNEVSLIWMVSQDQSIMNACAQSEAIEALSLASVVCILLCLA